MKKQSWPKADEFNEAVEAIKNRIRERIDSDPEFAEKFRQYHQELNAAIARTNAEAFARQRRAFNE